MDGKKCYFLLPPQRFRPEGEILRRHSKGFWPLVARPQRMQNKKKGNIICRELYHEDLSALNETAPTLSRALSFQSFFMAAFATDLVAIFNEEHALLLRKLFSEPLCMRGRRPRSECNGWEEKLEMAKIGLLCIVTAAWISGYQEERRINLHELISFARNSHDRLL